MGNAREKKSSLVDVILISGIVKLVLESLSKGPKASGGMEAWWLLLLSQHCSKSGPMLPLLHPHLCPFLEGAGTDAQKAKHSSHCVITPTPKKYDFRLVLITVLTQPPSVAGIVPWDDSLTFLAWTNITFLIYIQLNTYALSSLQLCKYYLYLKMNRFVSPPSNNGALIFNHCFQINPRCTWTGVLSMNYLIKTALPGLWNTKGRKFNLSCFHLENFMNNPFAKNDDL